MKLCIITVSASRHDWLAMSYNHIKLNAALYIIVNSREALPTKSCKGILYSAYFATQYSWLSTEFLIGTKFYIKRF